jgi:PAS domain S-box-containing protein
VTGNNAGEKYRLLSRYARDIILFARLQDGRIIEANQAAEKAYGYSRDRLLSLTILDLRADKDASAVSWQMTQANHEGILFESVHLRADGGTFPVEVSAASAMLGETPVLLSIIRDITERKRAERALRESEERLRLIVSTIKDYAIFSLDVTGNVITWNEGAERVTGYKPEEIIGRNDSLLYTLEDVTAGRPEQILAAALEHSYYEENGWRVRSNGTRFWADATTTVLRDEEGNPRGFSKIIWI